MGCRLARLIPALCVGIVGGWYLFPFPIHGLADNNDFWRVMEPAGIAYKAPSPPPLLSVTREFQFADSEMPATTTSAALPAFLAARSAKIFSESFDLRLLSALYFAIFLSGIALLSLSFGGWIFLLGLGWLSMEPTEFLHFNSFFSEAFSIALWPWLLWALQGTIRFPGKKYPITLAICALLIATSKIQFLLLPALLLVTLCFSAAPRGRFPIFALVTVMIVSFTFAHLTAGRRNLSLLNKFQSVFTGLATVADDPGEALHRLEIPAYYHYLAGTNLFLPPTYGRPPKPVEDALQRISFPQLAMVYLTTPGVFEGSVDRLQNALVRTPLGYLGNYEADQTGQTLSLPWQFSKLRDPLLHLAPWLCWVLCAAGIFLFIRNAQRRQWQDARNGLLLFLLLHFFSQLGVCVLGDGFFSLHRHLLSARLNLDLIFFLLADHALPFVAKYDSPFSPNS